VVISLSLPWVIWTLKHSGLNVSIYNPEQHYKSVRGKWIGLRTPDGR
jgi:hypothetical protein